MLDEWGLTCTCSSLFSLDELSAHLVPFLLAWPLWIASPCSPLKYCPQVEHKTEFSLLLISSLSPLDELSAHLVPFLLAWPLWIASPCSPLKYCPQVWHKTEFSLLLISSLSPLDGLSAHLVPFLLAWPLWIASPRSPLKYRPQVWHKTELSLLSISSLSFLDDFFCCDSVSLHMESLWVIGSIPVSATLFSEKLSGLKLYARMWSIHLLLWVGSVISCMTFASSKYWRAFESPWAGSTFKSPIKITFFFLRNPSSP